ncbi:MAG: DUF4920 domain-containing protein [Flavobacteriales bacterium]|nr:DUF4920 domain-containing protein [Flavobacteriales bacterium]
MKNILIVSICLLFVVACKENKTKADETTINKLAYTTYGEKISDDNVISKELAAEKFSNLKKGDTINLKFASTINEVCKEKGCWMKLDLGNNKESMVRFKDYGFFVPLNADHKEVIVNGKAFVTEISIDELRHYAKDAGNSEEEIAAITEPEFTYAFEADGVLMKQ